MLARKIFVPLVATLLTVVLAACGNDSTKKSSVPLDASYSPKPSPAAALDALLAAEQRMDRNASYALLAPEAREEFRRVEQWIERRNETGAITRFDVLEGEGKDGEAVATVEHQPGLDPFKGLIAGKERQTWTGVQFESGWLLKAEPVVAPEYPPDTEAPAVVKAWVEAVQACDVNRAEQLQAVKDIYAVGGPPLCRAPGPVITAEVGELPDGPVATEITDQYSTDASQWARTVRVTSPRTFSVVVAPIGRDWRVLGLIEN